MSHCKFQFIIIGNHENRRSKMFADALETMGLPSPCLISYDTLLLHDFYEWKPILQPYSQKDNLHVIVRFESPGENFTVTKRMIEVGYDAMKDDKGVELIPTLHTSPDIDSSKIPGNEEPKPKRMRLSPPPFSWIESPNSSNQRVLPDIRPLTNPKSENSPKQTKNGNFSSHSNNLSLDYDHGRIRYPRFWFEGFSHLLRMWSREIKKILTDVYFMNDPEETLLMFDKRKCSELLCQNGITVPHIFRGIASYEELVQHMTVKEERRCFVKLNSSSSASGVVAYSLHPQMGECAITSVEIQRCESETKFYNSLKMHVYRGAQDVRDIIDWLFDEDAFAEEWIPKARQEDHEFDIRFLTVAGEPKHFVLRCAMSGPITNLHLGNMRGDSKKFLEEIPKKSWENVKSMCHKTAACFPKSLYLGIDIALSPGYHTCTVIEVNAYGDLLPRLLHDGMDTYQSEVKAVIDRFN